MCFGFELSEIFLPEAPLNAYVWLSLLSICRQIRLATTALVFSPE